jgi:hypothetical protein
LEYAEPALIQRWNHQGQSAEKNEEANAWQMPKLIAFYFIETHIERGQDSACNGDGIREKNSDKTEGQDLFILLHPLKLVKKRCFDQIQLLSGTQKNCNFSYYIIDIEFEKKKFIKEL